MLLVTVQFAVFEINACKKYLAAFLRYENNCVNIYIYNIRAVLMLRNRVKARIWSSDMYVRTNQTTRAARPACV